MHEREHFFIPCRGVDKAQLGENAYDYIEIAVSNGVANGSVMSDTESFQVRTRTDTDSAYSPEMTKRGPPPRPIPMMVPMAADSEMDLNQIPMNNDDAKIAAPETSRDNV